MTTNKDKPLDVADPFARKLVSKYLQNRKQDVTRLTIALAESDFETIRVTGHNLYGSGAAYGLDDISWIGASIENAAEAQDAGKLKDLIDDLRSFLQRMRAY